MKKILHLVCNSHIDPVWQWDWDEGASASLATFYAACELLDKYDFIFCHNEVLIYEYIEKYDPQLFERIQKLVEIGKWKIMGGWYIQPDCLVPSGESFIRQCSLGREYFLDKFNARPRTALNFDSFGHTRGIPSVLKKCGFDSYIFTRPMPIAMKMVDKDLPHGPFIWEGYDGSQIKALRYEDIEANYTSVYGNAAKDIERKCNYYKDRDVRVALWGVGNHGGMSSAKDLEDIMVLKDQKKGEIEIIHSCLEDYFDNCGELMGVEKRQFIAFMKSYSSVHAIKLAHDQLENALYLTEKICTVADLAGKYHYNKEILKDAERTLCQIEFHDVLSGTAIKTGTDSSIRKAHGAIDNLKKEMYAAFAALSRDLPKVIPGDDNLVLLNPYPYDFDGYVESELYPLKYCLNDQKFELNVYDLNHKSTEYQIIKEESVIFHKKRIRIIYKAHIPAFSVVSYGIHVEVVDEKPKVIDTKNDIVVKDDVKTVKISRKTGLLESFKIGEKEFIANPAGVPFIFDDNADPWGWRMDTLTHATFSETGWPQPEKKKSLKEMKIDNSGKGLYNGLLGVTIVEQGDLLTQVQSLYTRGDSHVVVNYKIYKNTKHIDMNVHVLWAEASKGLKIKLPINGNKKYFAQMAFGIEEYNDMREYPVNRYIGVKNGEDCFVVYNNCGIHSASRIGKDLYITLLNGSYYCTHPTWEKNPYFADKTRFYPYVEQGAHDFSFRLGVNKLEECERLANEFNQQVYSVNHFPHGDGKDVAKDIIRLSNNNIVISALKRRNDGTYLIRLYNGSFKKSETALLFKGINKNIKLGKFEFKTFVYDGESIVESDDSSIY